MDTHDKAVNDTELDYPRGVVEALLVGIAEHNHEAVKHQMNRFERILEKLPYNFIAAYTFKAAESIEDHFKSVKNMSGAITFAVMTAIDKKRPAASAVEALYAECGKIMSMGFREVDAMSKVAHRAKTYIDENFRDRSININDVAKSVYLSVNYTRTLFKRYNGISITAYLNKKRYDEVIRLLCETEYPLPTICEMSGVPYNAYFFSSFKNHFGVTPLKYRKLHYKRINESADNND